MRLHIDSARRLGTIVAVIVVAALAASACGDKKGPDIISPSETYIPDFNRIWRNAANPDHTFFFNPNATQVMSGQLVDSNEDLNGTSSGITGTFNGRTLSFTIARRNNNAPAPVAVTGRFVTTEQIQLTFPNNVIVTLNRDPI